MNRYAGQGPPLLPIVEPAGGVAESRRASWSWLQEFLATWRPAVPRRWAALAAGVILVCGLAAGFVLGRATAPRKTAPPPASEPRADAATGTPIRPAAGSAETTSAEVEAIYQRQDVQDCLLAQRAGAPHFIDWQAATWRVQKIFRRDRAFDEFLYEQIRPAPPVAGRLMRFSGGANLKGALTCSLVEGWPEAGEFVWHGREEAWDGDRHELTEYRNGRRHGRKVTWVRGQLAAYAEYQHGRQSGRQVTFWEDGSVQNREVTGREAAREGAARGQLFDPDLVADWPEPAMPAAIKTWLADGKDGP